MSENNEIRINNTNQINVTTSMMTIWDSMSGAQLKISVLNSGLGLAIWLPLILPEGGRKYPTENRHSTVLNHKNAIAFEKAIIDNIIPLYERGENGHVGVFTNANHATMIEVEVRDGSFYFLIHRGCDPVTKIPNDTIRFKFDTSFIITNYNSATGEMDAEPIQSDFFLFFKAISAYNSLAGGYIDSHGTAMANTYYNQKFIEYMRAIADAVHAQLPINPQQNTGRYYGQNNNYQNYTDDSTGQNLPSINPMEVDNISDLVK